MKAAGLKTTSFWTALTRPVPTWPDPLLVTRKSRPYEILCRTFAAFLVVVGCWVAPFAEDVHAQQPLRIGIIGTGNVGGALARHWAAAGHELVVSSRHPEELEALAAELGPRVRAALPREAAVFGEVVLVAVPYVALPQIASDFKQELTGKVVVDTGNPFEYRDGAVAADALRRGTGRASAEYFETARLVRAFNATSAGTLRTQAFREPERIAVPIAGDDPAAVAVARRLVRDAGFEPVLVGSLDQAREFDPGGPLYRDDLSASEMEAFVASLERCWSWVANISTRLCTWLF